MEKGGCLLDLCQREVGFEFFEKVNKICLNIKLWLERQLIAATGLPPTVKLMALRRPMKWHYRSIHYDRSKPKQPWSRKRETWWKLKMWWTTGRRGQKWRSGYWSEGGNLWKLRESGVRVSRARINVLPRISDYNEKYYYIIWSTNSIKNKDV